ncbi:proteasome activator complex subunit 4A-like [Brevipalpus obovatus]|uniref:proteasome activator complex subunit 4A-like n=2 Tax=Brevipalpus obovatus TaxID=246614 RepID=UPI003D9F0F35
MMISCEESMETSESEQSNLIDTCDDDNFWAKRKSAIGFRAQCDNVYNRNLPYFDCLDDEAVEYLKLIKINLARGILLSEHKNQWFWEIKSYLALYGHFFPKDDHILFVKLLLEAIQTPNLEISSISSLVSILLALMRKRRLLSPKDLTIEWRPLYDLYLRCILERKYYFQTGNAFALEMNLKQLIEISRDYFPLSATREILDEVKPSMCPFASCKMFRATLLLDIFLPTQIAPEHHDKGFKLWLDDILKLWMEGPNSIQWEHNIFRLLSRLASQNIGYIDWTPYLPRIFTTYMQVVNLMATVMPQTIRLFSSTATITTAPDTSPAVTLMISSIGGPNSQALDYIEGLFKAVESYYHPSNMNRFDNRLCMVLTKITSALVDRLRKERDTRKTWFPKTPEEFRITDPEIDRFVDIMMPVLSTALFSRFGTINVATSLKDLAWLRPEKVIPPILEKLYMAFDLILESHRLNSLIVAVSYLAPTMIDGLERYDEGKSHLIPLLFALLPCLDPNDVKKSVNAFSLIKNLLTSVPIMDCSSIPEKNDLTEIEYNICLETSRFEEFVSIFVDKVLSLIETFTSEHRPEKIDNDPVRQGRDESFFETSMISCLSIVLQHSSPQIFETALSRLFSFMNGKLFEDQITCRTLASVCGLFTKAHPVLAMKKFLPYLISIIRRATDNEDVYSEESIDEHLTFALQILGEVMFEGLIILDYQEEIVDALRRCLRLKAVQGHQYAAVLLKNCLESLVSLYPTSATDGPNNFPYSWEEMSDFSKVLPIRLWGKPCELKTLKFDWHIPSEKELKFAQELVSEFLFDALEKLEQWTEERVTLSRDEVDHQLQIVLNVVIGICFSIEPFESKEYPLMPTRVPLIYERVHAIGISFLTLPDGRNLRTLIAQRVRKVLHHLISKHEDDTKSMNRIIKIYQCLLCWIKGKSFLKISLNQFKTIKKSFRKTLFQRKRLPRQAMIDRIRHQQEVRLSKKTWGAFTEIHRDLILDLITLSSSHYADVRTKAVSALTHFKHPWGYRLVGKELERIFLETNEQKDYEKREGALNILLNYRSSSSITSLSDWKCVTPVWLALVKCTYMEKNIIVSLTDKLVNFITPKFQPLLIDYQVSDTLKELALCMWQRGVSIDSSFQPTKEQIADGLRECHLSNTENLQCYTTLVLKLSESIEDGNLHWRHLLLAFLLLKMLIREDIEFPIEGVNVIAKNLLSDQFQIRQSCIQAIAPILRKCRPKTKKNVVKINFEANPGDNSSYKWLYFESDVDYYDEAIWSQTKFSHATYTAPHTSESNKIKFVTEKEAIAARGMDVISASEKPFFEFFQDKEKVGKLLELVTIDNNISSMIIMIEKNRLDLATVFKTLFRNFGVNILPSFAIFLEKMAEECSSPQDGQNKKREELQRAAVEVILGVMIGSKYWPYKDMIQLRAVLEPLFGKLFTQIITPETLRHWMSIFSNAMLLQDGRRFSWIFTSLLNDPLNSGQNLASPSNMNTNHHDVSESTSFQQTARLNMLCFLLHTQCWRGIPLNVKLAKLFMQKDFLRGSYRQIRGLLGALLATMSEFDVKLSRIPTPLIGAPKVDHFFDTLLPELEYFLKNSSTNDTPPIKTELSSLPSPTSSLPMSALNLTPLSSKSQPSKTEENEEEKEAFKLLMTVCYWVQSQLAKSPRAIKPIYYRLLPIICEAVNRTKDEEISQTLFITLKLLSGCLLDKECIEAALTNCSKMIQTTKSWHTKISVVSFLRTMVSMNLFILMSDEKVVKNVTDMIISLLEDERIEVREETSVVLGGIIHYNFIKVNAELIDMFKLKSNEKVERIQNSGVLGYNAEKLVRKHAGVLGLCSIVKAFPYDVPDFLPNVLMILVDHLHDPQPIPGTIRKCLSDFKRTHHDNWRQHKEKFNDDQLAIITDLLVSPNYYA